MSYNTNTNKTTFEKNLFYKPDKLTINKESILKKINETTHDLFINNYKDHIPVFGWSSMNYPSSIKQSLVKKYETKNKEMEKVINNLKEKEQIERENSNKEKNDLNNYLFYKSSNNIAYKKKNFRVDPDIVNLDVINESNNLVNAKNNVSEKFNIKNNNKELFYKEIINSIAKSNINLIYDEDVPYNYNLKDIINLNIKNNNKHLNQNYELNFKNSYSILSTNSYNKKLSNYEIKYSFDIKYSNIYPKYLLLGDKGQNNNFSQPIKKIGDISFEEEYEPENLKDLKRYNNDNLTDEVLKLNLNNKLIKLNIENHYWISLDTVSKLGRMSNSISILNLRNLLITTDCLSSILTYAKK